MSAVEGDATPALQAAIDAAALAEPGEADVVRAAEDLPPVVQRVSEVILRGQRKFASAEAMAMLIVNSGEVRDGLVALQAVDKLKTLHVATTIPDHWNSGVTDIRICNHCRTAWPCDDADILGVAA